MEEMKTKMIFNDGGT